MEIVVDYNNIGLLDRKRGPTYVIDRILSTLSASRLHAYNKVSFRLYDGWYDLRRLTRRAQQISAEIQAAFPATRSYLGPTGSSFSLIVNAELAYSLRSDPTVHLWHTYRRRSGQANLSCHTASSVGCTNIQCPLIAMHRFFSTEVCPTPNCTVGTETAIVRDEQKLVDTMMVADIFHLLLQNESEVVVVTSDDDLWPALKMALLAGMQVTHIHTKSNRATPAFYMSGVGPQYQQLHL